MFIFSSCTNNIITIFWYYFWGLTWKSPPGVPIPGSSLLWPNLVPYPNLRAFFTNMTMKWPKMEIMYSRGKKYRHPYLTLLGPRGGEISPPLVKTSSFSFKARLFFPAFGGFFSWNLLHISVKLDFWLIIKNFEKSLVTHISFD